MGKNGVMGHRRSWKFTVCGGGDGGDCWGLKMVTSFKE